MIRLSPEEFEEMVVQCYEGLPEGLIGYLENLDIVVEEWPSEELLAETEVGSGRRTVGAIYGGFAAGAGGRSTLSAGQDYVVSASDREDLRHEG